MTWLRIRDGVADAGFLTFDLRDVLRALGPDALGWTWTVSAVEENGQTLEAVGEGLADLGTLERSGERVADSRLVQIAERIHQVIWGEFRAYRDRIAAEPSVRVVAFDASFYEVWCDDDAAIARLRAAFKETELVTAAAP